MPGPNGEAIAPVSPNLKKTISEHDALLAIHVATWLRKRGKTLRPKLNEEQKQQLEECFELMDADGSGAIDADELGAAFKLLGLAVKKAEIVDLLAEVDADGSGEVEYPEFIEIMTSTLAKLAERKEQAGGTSNQVPFALLATAYRRKRIMEGLISGDREVTAQVVSIAEEAARRAAEEAAAQQSKADSRMRHSSQTTSFDGAAISSSSSYSSSSGPAAGSSNSSSSSGERSSRMALQAGASHGLLRALNKVKSLRNPSSLLGPSNSVSNSVSNSNNNSAGSSGDGSTSSSSNKGASSSSSSSGGAGLLGCECSLLVEQLAEVLGEEEQAQLAEILKQTARKRLATLAPSPAAAPAAAPSAAAAAGRSRSCPADGGGSCSISNASNAAVPASAAAGSQAGAAEAAAAAAAAVVGVNQHITSKLQQKLLTQQLQMPKFSLNPSRSATNSPSEQQQQPHSRSRSRCSSTAASPLPPHGAAVINPLVNAQQPGSSSHCCSPALAKSPVGSPSSHSTSHPKSRSTSHLASSRSAHNLSALGTGAGTMGVSAGRSSTSIHFGDCTIHEFHANHVAVSSVMENNDFHNGMSVKSPGGFVVGGGRSKSFTNLCHLNVLGAATAGPGSSDAQPSSGSGGSRVSPGGGSSSGSFLIGAVGGIAGARALSFSGMGAAAAAAGSLLPQRDAVSPGAALSAAAVHQRQQQQQQPRSKSVGRGSCSPGAASSSPSAAAGCGGQQQQGAVQGTMQCNAVQPRGGASLISKIGAPLLVVDSTKLLLAGGGSGVGSAALGGLGLSSPNAVRSSLMGAFAGMSGSSSSSGC